MLIDEAVQSHMKDGDILEVHEKNEIGQKETQIIRFDLGQAVGSLMNSYYKSKEYFYGSLSFVFNDILVHPYDAPDKVSDYVLRSLLAVYARNEQLEDAYWIGAWWQSRL